MNMMRKVMSFHSLLCSAPSDPGPLAACGVRRVAQAKGCSDWSLFGERTQRSDACRVSSEMTFPQLP